MSDAPEFSRMVVAAPLPARPVDLIADEKERAALARRFDLVAVNALHASIDLSEENRAGRARAVLATGKLEADIVQSCAVSGEDLPVRISDSVVLRFVPDFEAGGMEGEEAIELDADACDEIGYEGDRFDLGEAVAQTLGLAIDPFAAGPDAETVRAENPLMQGEPSGPFAALAALKKD